MSHVGQPHAAQPKLGIMRVTCNMQVLYNQTQTLGQISVFSTEMYLSFSLKYVGGRGKIKVVAVCFWTIYPWTFNMVLYVTQFVSIINIQ